MTTPIGPIAPIGSLSGPAGVSAIRADITDPQAASGADFASKLAEGLEYVQGMQSRTNELSVQAATGSLNDVHEYMIASAESGIATSLTVAVRNKAVEAFQEIMRMQA